MAFYFGEKQEFVEEQYLNLPTKSHRVNIANLRSGSHNFTSNWDNTKETEKKI